MKPDDADVFLPGALLRFDQSGRTVDADDEAAGDFRVEGTGMTGLLDTEDPFEPGDDFMGRGIGGFVQVDNAGSGGSAGSTAERELT